MKTRYTFHNKLQILNPAYFLIIQGCLSIHFLSVFFRVGFSYPFDINFPVSIVILSINSSFLQHTLAYLTRTDAVTDTGDSISASSQIKIRI